MNDLKIYMKQAKKRRQPVDIDLIKNLINASQSNLKLNKEGCRK